jgi:hypothetical protein
MKFMSRSMALPIAFITTTLFGSLLLSASLPIAAQILPKPPDTGTPTGNPTPGTSRPEASCPKMPKELTAIVANNSKDFTLSAHPTVWFYIPYSAAQLSRIEFLLLSGNERQTIYQTNIQLIDKPGVIKITIPTDSKYALKPNQNYRWRLNVDCQPDKTIEPDVSIDGWVRRISPAEGSRAQAPSKDYQAWYDAIDAIATRHFANPTNGEATKAWSDLLKTLKFPWVQPEPFTNSKLVASP